MLQRVARLLVVLLALFALALVVVWVVTNTEFGRERVRRFALGALSKATHGIVKMRTTTLNERGETVQVLVSNVLMPRRLDGQPA